jgi:DNA-directed RNA polymerase specialized sigma24 family protein
MYPVEEVELSEEKEKIGRIERPLEESLVVFSPSIDEILELRYREKVLSKEQKGLYPEWNELSDQRLTEVLLMLREDERHFIYQHVFEERTFKEIGCLNGIKEDKVKNIYYYAIYKIRKWMEGDR